MSKITVPGLRTDVVDTANMVKLTKTYSNGNVTVVYAAKYCSMDAIRNGCGDYFFNHGNASRPSYSFHRSGVVTGNTDRHASNRRPPIRRRAVYILCWSDSDKSWDMWSCGSVSSIAQGKCFIDKILDSGILPD